jgi:mRNA-degrading endonuclease RelE of RelBE toxin-antitoxin system
MQFRIADTFTGSLSRLTAQEQKAAKTTAFDLQLDPSSPGHSFHKLDRAKDQKFWSVRVNADIRIIVHRAESGVLLCYVGHHDDAYRWAERRKIEKHPVTGAMQLVEVRERVEQGELFTPRPPPPHEKQEPKLVLFEKLKKAELMSFGVPEEWVDDVRRADEDTLFDLLKHLPQEAQEALLKLAVGEKPQPPEPAPTNVDPFEHPDSQRRFRVLDNLEELRRALDFPWEKWAIFLHPTQRQLVQRKFSGPARVSGSAGTGKTIVALHRAVDLARSHTASRVLLTTYSKTLAHSLKLKLGLLVAGEPEIGARIEVKPLTAVGHDLYTKRFGQPNMASDTLIASLIASAAKEEGSTIAPTFLKSEWDDVVDAWQVNSWDEYANVQRLGRRTRVGPKQREVMWRIFARVREGLVDRKTVTWAGLFQRLGDDLGKTVQKPFDHIVVDEAQDLSVAEARFLSRLAGGKADGLFFAGDIGQRIFQQPFSWKSLGIDVRGRSSVLKINYRTSHQIRSAADRLLPGHVADVDGNTETRKGTVSVFEGPAPEVQVLKNAAEERDTIAGWITARLAEGLKAGEIGVFVRSEAELSRARAAVKTAMLKSFELDGRTEPEPGSVVIGTMHLAKGLEFRAVAVMACDDQVMPLQQRVESVTDESDLEEVYDTERHLLYVACTRARDHLFVSGVEPGSEFLSDFVVGSATGRA